MAMTEQISIKAELRLIRKKTPDRWNEIIEEFCPAAFNDSLENPCEIRASIDIGDDTCLSDNCDECWNKSIESGAE